MDGGVARPWSMAMALLEMTGDGIVLEFFIHIPRPCPSSITQNSFLGVALDLVTKETKIQTVEFAYLRNESQGRLF